MARNTDNIGCILYADEYDIILHYTVISYC